MVECKYLLPCGLCDKSDELEPCMLSDSKKECDHDWQTKEIYMYHDKMEKPHYRITKYCSICGRINIEESNELKSNKLDI